MRLIEIKSIIVYKSYHTINGKPKSKKIKHIEKCTYCNSSNIKQNPYINLAGGRICNNCKKWFEAAYTKVF